MIETLLAEISAAMSVPFYVPDVDDDEEIDGDDVLAIAGLNMLSKGILKQKTLVATVMSNSGLDNAFQKAGGFVKRTPVGDKHVIDLMRQEGLNLGGESSGHLIFGDHATTGDGLIAALQILVIMKEHGKSLEELARCWKRLPQLVRNVPVREKTPFEELDGLTDLIASAEKELQNNGGRILLRYSGTESKARLLLEGPEIEKMEKWSAKILSSIRNQIGAE